MHRFVSRKSFATVETLLAVTYARKSRVQARSSAVRGSYCRYTQSRPRRIPVAGVDAESGLNLVGRTDFASDVLSRETISGYFLSAIFQVLGKVGTKRAGVTRVTEREGNRTGSISSRQICQNTNSFPFLPLYLCAHDIRYVLPWLSKVCIRFRNIIRGNMEAGCKWNSSIRGIVEPVWL